MNHKPLLAIVGGPDVDARLPLMARLAAHYDVCAYGSEPRAGERFATTGFAFHRYPLDRRVRPWTDVRTVLHLRRAFAERRPAIVQAFDTKPGVFGAIAARRAGVPVVVVTITGLGALYSANNLRTRVLRSIYQVLQRLAARHADALVFQNHDDRRELVAAGVVPLAKTAVILGSGIDTAAFSPAAVPATARRDLRAELGIPQDAVVVTMIARVTASKGVPEFVAAARAVTAAVPAARFLLVGPEDEASEQRLTPADLAELRRTVVWPGRRDDIARVLAASDMLVLPTAYREGVPRVLLEAGAMQLPLVATDSPGCNEVAVPDESGLLVPVGDRAALVAAIRRLVDDPALRARLGTGARIRVVGAFDLGLVARQYEDLYERLAEQAVSRRPSRPGPCGTACRDS